MKGDDLTRRQCPVTEATFKACATLALTALGSQTLKTKRKCGRKAALSGRRSRPLPPQGQASARGIVTGWPRPAGAWGASFGSKRPSGA